MTDFNEGWHTSKKCLRCGTDLEYWIVESPFVTSDLEPMYNFVIGCRNCYDQLASVVSKEIHLHPQDYAEFMASDLIDRQKERMEKERDKE